MADLSVIIPTLKPRNQIECLDVLERQSFTDFEVLVQNEDSATKARNAGIKRASAEKLVFLDDDSHPREGYLERISEVLDREAAVAGKTVHARDDIFAKRFAGHYDFGDSARYVTRFWGCNMAVRKEVFDTVGMWDESIPWGHEEIELAERVLTEYPIYYDPDLVVDHVYADSVRDYWRKMYRIERQKPYIWERQGLSEGEQWLRVIGAALDVTNYLGHSVQHAVIRGGGTIAKTIGRVRGMRSIKRSGA
jgi:GT2 family glycosyltransferase